MRQPAEVARPRVMVAQAHERIPRDRMVDEMHRHRATIR